jgi:hypothetical protein
LKGRFLRDLFLGTPPPMVAMLDVVLMAVVAARLLTRRALSVVAAALLAITPGFVAHLHSESGFLLAVILAWLWCLVWYGDEGRRVALWASTMLLGLGSYTGDASVVMMPLYVVITCLLMFGRGERRVGAYLIALGGFLMLVLPFLVWLWHHPAAYHDFVVRHTLYDASRFGPLQGAKELASYVSLSERVGVYYEYFDPSFLFFDGRVFLASYVVLLPLGVYVAIKHRYTPIAGVLLAGLLTAPAAAALFDQRERVDYALPVIVFGVLVAMFGVEFLISRSAWRWKVLATLLLFVSLLQAA